MMRSLKNLFKNNKAFFSLFKYIQIRWNFVQNHFSDLVLSFRYAMPMAETKGGYRYRVLMLAHFLEKGMSYSKLRPFGQRHIKDILVALNRFEQGERQLFEYQVGLSALSEWLGIFDAHGWQDEPLLPVVRDFLGEAPRPGLPWVGARLEGNGEYPFPPSRAEAETACKAILDRHSIRDFAPGSLSKDDLDLALRCMQATPTACNRQPCKIYQIENEQLKNRLHKEISGIGGLNKETLHYFMVTYDMMSLSKSLERNQGFLNAGLVAMNFVNGLHASGIGTCFLQWQRKEKYEKKLRKVLGIPESQRIAVFIAAGRPAGQYRVPVSARKPLEEVFTVLK